MSVVPLRWVSFCEDNPAEGRWDNAFLRRVLEQREWSFPGGVQFSTTAEIVDGAVIVFPAGHYLECTRKSCGVRAAYSQLNEMMHGWSWCVLFVVSDEGARFPVEEIRLPNRSRLYVMTPRPEVDYPAGTRFMGEGSPSGPNDFTPALVAPSRCIDISFAGQVNHERREAAFEQALMLSGKYEVELHPSDGFAQGLSTAEYNALLSESRLVLCPAGAVTQSTFRAYEALEAGAVPILDGLRADGQGAGFWSMVFDEPSALDLLIVDDWKDLPKRAAEILEDRRHGEGGYWRWNAVVSSAWQRWKRRFSVRLQDDVRELSPQDPELTLYPDSEITVLIPTSPTPDNDIDVILTTITSVRERLPLAEIIVMIDGVRDEQRSRFGDYWMYAAELCLWVNQQPNMVAMAHWNHQHQSGLTREALKLVRTPYILFVEHDTPLEGDIDFTVCLKMMTIDRLNYLRFHYDESIHPEHAPLYLETEPVLGPYVRTVQWSQRPHLAPADFYRQILSTYFAEHSRTMIEDVMHGVTQHMYTPGLPDEGLWSQWRMAVYHPGGPMRRSGHLDARGDDPKYPMLIAYPGEKPEGAPRPGFH